MARRITVTTDKKIRALDVKNLIPLWVQATAYVIGSMVVAPTNGTYKEADGQVWRCITAHTSSTGEAAGKDWADDTVYWTRSQLSLNTRQGALSDSRIEAVPTGESTLVAGAFYRKDVSNLGAKLVAPAGAWDQATAYVVGDVGTEPAGYTVATGHTYSKKYRCIVAHTSTTGGTHAADFATDLAAGYWAELTGGIAGESNVVGKKDIVTVTHGTSGKVLKQDTGEILGYVLSHGRPLTDTITDDLDERLQPDPTLSNEQLIYTYEDTYGLRQEYLTAQSSSSLRLIGVRKE